MRAVYLGGPITGLTFDDAADWRETIIKRPDWPEGWVALSPMRDKEQFRIAGPLPSTFDEGAAAVRQDLADIDASSAVLFNFLGASITSLGSCAEMGYAYARNKPIIIVRDPHSAGNPHDHVFVDYMASVTVCDVSSALTEIGGLETNERRASRAQERRGLARPLA